MNELYLKIFFYFENCLYIKREDGYIQHGIATILCLYLVISATIKMLNNGIDLFNIFYMVIGFVWLFYEIYIAFRNAYKKYRLIKNEFGYQNLSEYYAKQ